MNRVTMDWRTADLTPVDRALCEFATKLTKTPESMGAEDADGLRALGLDDLAIHDAVQVIGYFNYINRVADALGVEPEKFVRKWEQPGAPPNE